MKIVKTLLLSSLLATAAFHAQALSPQEQLKQGLTALEQGNYQKVYELWLPLAEQGNMLAQAGLGVIYLDGKGVKQDNHQAFKWFQKAAEQGYAYAQVKLGLMYEKGEGVKQDYYQALSWFRKAAEQGDARALGLVGFAYLEGQGVKQDKQQAKAYFGRSCDAGMQEGCDMYRLLNGGK